MELLYNGGRDIPTKYHMLTNKIPSERNGLSPFEILATGIPATSKYYSTDYCYCSWFLPSTLW